jgi:hypothetical protein
LPIFGDQKANPEERGEKHGDSEERGQQRGDMNNSGHEGKGSTGSSDSISGTEQNSRGVSNNGSMSGADHDSGNLISATGQNNIVQNEHVPNSSIDLNSSQTNPDEFPAVSGSAAVGAHIASGLLAVGGAQADNPGVKLLVDGGVPSSYANNATGFNFIANDVDLIDRGMAMVDSVKVTWGVYAGGITFDASGKAIAINHHPFAYVDGGVTPPTVVSSMSGNATFSNVVGSTKPVTESGNLGGSVSLNVGINLGAATVTSYNLAVTDANSRSWTGTLNNGPVALSTFAQNGTPLAVSCGGCGSGTASGSATGILIGPNAKGLISSYVLSTTTGQAVAGAAIISRP